MSGKSTTEFHVNYYRSGFTWACELLTVTANSVGHKMISLFTNYVLTGPSETVISRSREGEFPAE